MQVEKGRASLDQSFSEIRHYALSPPERVCDKRIVWRTTYKGRFKRKLSRAPVCELIVMTFVPKKSSCWRATKIQLVDWGKCRTYSYNKKDIFSSKSSLVFKFYFIACGIYSHLFKNERETGPSKLSQWLLGLLLGTIKKNGPSSDPTNNCATHFGSRSLFVSKVANVQSTPCPNPGVLFYPSGERTLGTRLVLPLALARFYLSPMQTDATSNIVGYHMLRPFAHSPCFMLLEVVAQSLKPVKSLSTCKRTEQLPTCWANNVGSFCTSTVEREQNLGGIR